MNLSIRNFAVAALVGVANARQSAVSKCFKIDLPNPEQYVGRDWKELQNAYFNYLSQCSDNEDEMKFAEGAEFLTELKRRFVASNEMSGLTDDDEGEVKVVRTSELFRALDLDRDTILTRREYLQYMRQVKVPFDLQQEYNKPFIPLNDDLFTYISKDYDESVNPPVNIDVRDRAISKDQLMASFQILMPGFLLDEEYYDIEWRLRDFNLDGFIDYEENKQYRWHYNHMVKFWNQLKRANDPSDTRDDSQPISEHENMTLAEWMNQENPWLKRDYEGKEIPDYALEQRFRYYELDGDDELEFHEIWMHAQEDHIQWMEYQDIFNNANLDGNDHLDYDEIRSYFDRDPEYTGEEVDQKAQELMKILNVYAHDEKVFNDEGWLGYHRFKHSEMRRIEQLYDTYYNFEGQWYALDLNRDKYITEFEAKASEESEEYDWDSLKAAYRVALTDDNRIAYEPAQEHFLNVIAPNEKKAEILWKHAMRPGLFIYDLEEEGQDEYDELNPGTIEQVMANDRRKKAVLEIMGYPEELTPESEANIMKLLQHIDTDSNGIFTKRDICVAFVGDIPFLCGRYEEDVYYQNNPQGGQDEGEGEVEDEGEGESSNDGEGEGESSNDGEGDGDSPDINVQGQQKQAQTFNDIWDLVQTLDDGELTREDLMNLIDYVMPGATLEEINYEFNLHDIDHDGAVDRHEGYHVHHTEDLRMTIQKANETWAQIDRNNDNMVSFDEFSDIYDVLYALGYAPEKGLHPEEQLQMYAYLDTTHDSDSTNGGFPIMHLVDTLGKGIFNVFDDILDRA